MLRIARPVDDHPPDPFNLHELLDQAKRDHDIATQNLWRAQKIKTVAEFQMSQLREQALLIAALKGTLPKLLVNIDSTIGASIALQRKFVDIKDRASKLSRQTQTIQKSIQNTVDLGVVQQEFVGGLLTICKQVLIDPRLLDEVKLVTDIVDRRFKLTEISSTTRAAITAIAKEMEGKVSIYQLCGEVLGPLGVPVTKKAAARYLPSSKVDRFDIGFLGLPVVQAVSS